MADSHTRRITGDTHVAVRIVDGVLNVAVLQIAANFLHRHTRTVLLCFLRGSAQMWGYDHTLRACGGGVREISHIAGYFSLLQRVHHSLLVYQKIPGIVQNYYAVLHLV